MKKCLLLIGLLPVLAQAATKDDLALLAHQFTVLQFAVPGAAAAKPAEKPKAGARADEKKTAAASAEDYQEHIYTASGYAYGRIPHTVEQADTSLKQLAAALEKVPAGEKDRIQDLYYSLQVELLKKILPEMSEFSAQMWPFNMKNFQADKAQHAESIYDFIRAHKKALEQNKHLYGVQRILALLDVPEIAAAAAEDKKRQDEGEATLRKWREDSPEGKAAKLRAEEEPKMAAELKQQDALFEPLAKLGAFKADDNVFAARQKMMLDEQVAWAGALWGHAPTLTFNDLYQALEKDRGISYDYINKGSKLAALSMKNKIDGFAWCQKLMDVDLVLHNLFSDNYLLTWHGYRRYQETLPKALENSKRDLTQAELAVALPEQIAKNMVILWQNFDRHQKGSDERHNTAVEIKFNYEKYKKELAVAAQEGSTVAQMYLNRFESDAYQKALK